MTIVFFGTSNVALPVLEALRAEHEIKAVVTSPDAKSGRKQALNPSPVALLAEELNLPLLKPETVKGNATLVEQLSALQADIFIVVSYGKILPLEIINLPPHKTLNIHFSLLPKYRGASPLQTAILNGDKSTGTTVFVLEEKLDTGPIVAQQDSAIDDDDTFLTLSQRVARQSAELLLDALPDYASGKIIPQPQDETGATYTKIISKRDGRVDWQKTSVEIYDQFRAFYPWPGIWTTWQGKNLKILGCGPVDVEIENNPAQPGAVLPGGIVACGDGATFLKISSLQLEGKNPLSISEFLNGYKDFIGGKLD